MNPLVAGSYSRTLPAYLAHLNAVTTWDAAADAATMIREAVASLGTEFELVDSSTAFHRTSQVHPSAVITGPCIVSERAEIGPYVRLRDGVFVGAGTSLGASVEVKSTWLFEDTSLAHLNYVGNSVVGHDVNVEAGAVVANHFNERADSLVLVVVDGQVTSTGRAKFGAAIGARARIGANAVTTPGTVLAAGEVIARLELVDQVTRVKESDAHI